MDSIKTILVICGILFGILLLLPLVIALGSIILALIAGEVTLLGCNLWAGLTVLFIIVFIVCIIYIIRG